MDSHYEAQAAIAEMTIDRLEQVLVECHVCKRQVPLVNGIMAEHADQPITHPGQTARACPGWRLR